MNKRKELYALLMDLGLKKIRNTTNGFTACCPFHDDQKPSFSINTEGLWICFACGEKGNLSQLISKLKGSIENYKVNLQILNINLDNLLQPQKQVKKRIAGISYYPYLNEQDVPQYLLNRLAFKTIREFELGFSDQEMYKDYIIIPVKFENKFVGFQARLIGDDPNKQRYLNPHNWDIKKYLFNYDLAKQYDTIIVTEGVFSVMSMYEKNIKNSVATFGAAISNEQVSLLLRTNAKHIVLCLDNDEPGLKTMLEIGKIISDFIDTRVMILPEGKDPNDLSRNEIYLIFRDSLTYNNFVKYMEEKYGFKDYKKW